MNHKASRLFSKLYANSMGYFWLPCPVCGEDFGGHEWKNTSVGIAKGDGVTEGICNDCADRIQKEHPEWDDILLDPITHEASERDWSKEMHPSKDGTFMVGNAFREV